MSKLSAQEKAIRQTVEKLLSRNAITDTNLHNLDLSVTNGKKSLPLRIFGTNMILNPADFQLTIADTGKPSKSGDRLLLLHYLLCDVPICPANELISFRDIPGGQFYWQAFVSRTVKPLATGIGNDLELLRKNLNRFDWETVDDIADIAAKIHALGKIYVTLIYRCKDEEFPASAQLLFDASIKRVYSAEDAAVLASRICLGLL